MNKDKCFQLGYVSKVHGLHGEVIAVLDVDFADDYEDLEHVFVEQKSRLTPFFIEHFVLQPNNRALVKFEEFDNKDKADTLVGAAIYLPLDMLKDLEEEQYYFHELIGFEVWDEVSGNIGIVKLIYDLETQDLLGVDMNGKEVLVPIQDQIILKVDKAAKKVFCRLPEGLIDIYLEE